MSVGSDQPPIVGNRVAVVCDEDRSLFTPVDLMSSEHVWDGDFAHDAPVGRVATGG